MSSQEDKSSGRSPLSGCVILITALCVVVFLIVFSTWALFRQFDEIVKFTEDTQTKVSVVDVADHQDDWVALQKRVGEFVEALDGDQPAELRLSPVDLNLAIAAWDPLKELRETFHVDSIADGVISISISFPMNGRPRLAKEGEAGWMVSDSRYLEGTMIAEPAVSGREVVLRILDLEVPESRVPKEFVEQMSPYRITERYVTDAEIGPVMAKLTRAEIRDGALYLIRLPGEHREGYIDDKEVDFSRNRLVLLLGVAACLFLVVAGLIVFFGLRKSAR